jgi:hypothetical protein
MTIDRNHNDHLNIDEVRFFIDDLIYSANKSISITTADRQLSTDDNLLNDMFRQIDLNGDNKLTFKGN